MHKLMKVYDEIQDDIPSFLELHRIVKCQGMGKNEILNVMKLANNHELPYLVSRLEIEYQNWEASLANLKTRTKESTDTQIYQPAMNEMKERASLDLGLMRRNNMVKNSIANMNKYRSDTEVFYADGSWKIS